MKDFFNSQRIVEIIWKWRLHLVVAALIAIVLAAIFSSPAFITPKYKSSARLYPINLFAFSEESETEQMLEIINSSDIKKRMIEAHNLGDVYKINRDDPHFWTYILAEYNDHVKSKKTEYEAVNVSVLDKDPQRACDMVDSLISFYNLKVGKLHGLKYLEVVEILDRDIALLKTELDSLQKVMKQYGKPSIFDYETLSKEATEAYMKSLAKGSNPGGRKEIEKILGNLQEKGVEYHLLNKRIKTNVHTIDSLRTEQDLALSNATKKITYAHVVEHPFPADKKSYPVRWIIVVVTTLATLFFALIIILIIENLKWSKKR